MSRLAPEGLATGGKAPVLRGHNYYLGPTDSQTGYIGSKEPQIGYLGPTDSQTYLRILGS